MQLQRPIQMSRKQETWNSSLRSWKTGLKTNLASLEITYNHCWPNWKQKVLTVLKHWKYWDAVLTRVVTKIKALWWIIFGRNWRSKIPSFKYNITIVCCSLPETKSIPNVLRRYSMKWLKQTSNRKCKSNLPHRHQQLSVKCVLKSVTCKMKAKFLFELSDCLISACLGHTVQLET